MGDAQSDLKRQFKAKPNDSSPVVAQSIVAIKGASRELLSRLKSTRIRTDTILNQAIEENQAESHREVVHDPVFKVFHSFPPATCAKYYLMDYLQTTSQLGRAIAAVPTIASSLASPYFI